MKNAINPDSVVLQQLEGYWQKVAMILLWKTSGNARVDISTKDMQDFAKAFEPGVPVLFTHGLTDSIGFQLVDETKARELAAHDAAQRVFTVQ